MNVLKEIIAPVFSNPWTIWTVVGGLALWATISGLRLKRGVSRLSKSLEYATSRLSASDGALSFRSHYEKVADELAREPILGSPWRDYRESLIVPSHDGRPIRSTMRPEAWFGLGALLRLVRVDSRYHAALPNLLVGAGLLFTFIGLAVALDSAGGIVTPKVSVDTRNLELKKLLDAASFKFITSLFGLFFSIAYALWRKRQLSSVEKALDGFLSAVESRIPIITPAALQQDANAWLEKQSTQLETFSTQLAINIGSAFDAAFDQRLGEHIGPLTEAIQKLSDGMASRNEDAMQRMLEAFLDRLQGSAGDRMHDVAESLAGLGTRLEGLQSGLGDAAERMARSADVMVTRMGEGAESALNRITDQMGGLVESLRNVADQTRTAGANAGELLAQRIEQAAIGFESSARTVAETLASAARGMEQKLTDETAASSGRLTAQLELMVAELRTLAETSRATGTAAFESLAERIAVAASGFEETAKRIAQTMNQAADATGSTFGHGAEDAVRRIAEATEGMRSELQVMLVEFKGSMSEAGDSVRNHAREGGEALLGTMEIAGSAFATAVSSVAAGLQEAGNAASTALREGGRSAASSLNEGAGTLNNGAAGLAGRVHELGEAVQRIGERLVEFEKAAREATSPLATSAADLRASGEAARAAMQPLQSLSKDLRTATEQMAGAAQRIDAAHQAAVRLTDSLNTATGRFEKLDVAMAGTVQELMNGLQGFTTKVREFVVDTDSNLANAANHLGSLTESLEETLDSFLEQFKKAA